MPQRAAVAACLVLAMVLVSFIIRLQNLASIMQATERNSLSRLLKDRYQILPAEKRHAGPAARNT